MRRVPLSGLPSSGTLLVRFALLDEPDSGTQLGMPCVFGTHSVTLRTEWYGGTFPTIPGVACPVQHAHVGKPPRACHTPVKVLRKPNRLVLHQQKQRLIIQEALAEPVAPGGLAMPSSLT